MDFYELKTSKSVIKVGKLKAAKTEIWTTKNYDSIITPSLMILRSIQFLILFALF